MKNPTIWETASRPLFVRTVWLEGSDLRRGLQRHFLWDYDTNKSLERLNCDINPLHYHRPDNLKRSISLELSNDFNDFNGFSEAVDEVFLLGSAKAKLHEPHKLRTNKRSKLSKQRARSTLINRQYASYGIYNFASSKDISRRSSAVSQLCCSRKNSLSQSQRLIETDDVLLAERVLNWLDLAGKENCLRNLNELKEMEVKLSKTSKLRQDAIKRYNNPTLNSVKGKTNKTKNYEGNAKAAAPKNHKATEPVKHITIIFNKEGQPIRLNRPAKNIDLCSLSNSPNTTRKLAGTLASARLYKSIEKPRLLNVPKTAYMKSKTASRHRRLDTVADLNNCTLQKRLHENPKPPTNCSSLHDSKKQLHIFMPTLPKKGLGKSVYGTEDGTSELSQNFSELCRI